MNHNLQLALSRAVAESKRSGQIVSLDWEADQIEAAVEYVAEAHPGHVDSTTNNDGTTTVDAWTRGMPDGQFDFRLQFVPVPVWHNA